MSERSDTILSDDEIMSRVDQRHWRIVDSQLECTFKTRDFVTGTRFVVRISDAAEGMDHHPDVDLRYGTVRVAMMSHDVGGLTARDPRLANEISSIADEFEFAADASSAG